MESDSVIELLLSISGEHRNFHQSVICLGEGGFFLNTYLTPVPVGMASLLLRLQGEYQHSERKRGLVNFFPGQRHPQ